MVEKDTRTVEVSRPGKAPAPAKSSDAAGCVWGGGGWTLIATTQFTRGSHLAAHLTLRHANTTNLGWGARLRRPTLMAMQTDWEERTLHGIKSGCRKEGRGGCGGSSPSQYNGSNARAGIRSRGVERQAGAVVSTAPCAAGPHQALPHMSMWRSERRCLCELAPGRTSWTWLGRGWQTEWGCGTRRVRRRGTACPWTSWTPLRLR